MSAAQVFPIVIGSFKRDYVIRETTAPQRYDGGSTITVHEYKELDPRGGDCPPLKWRVVLIEAAQLAWHEGRYGSGLHQLREPEYMDPRAVVDVLVGRLLPAEEPFDAKDAGPVYTLEQIRRGTGFKRGARFAQVGDVVELAGNLAPVVA
jgi:hypothetical protein